MLVATIVDQRYCFRSTGPLSLSFDGTDIIQRCSIVRRHGLLFSGTVIVVVSWHDYRYRSTAPILFDGTDIVQRRRCRFRSMAPLALSLDDAVIARRSSFRSTVPLSISLDGTAIIQRHGYCGRAPLYFDVTVFVRRYHYH